MDSRYLSRPLLVKMILIYVLVSGIFYGTANHQLNYRAYDMAAKRQDDTVGELVDGMHVCQIFTYQGDYIRTLRMMPGTYMRLNDGKLHLELSDAASGMALWQSEKDLSDVQDNTALEFTVECKLEPGMNRLCLKIWSEGCSAGNAITLYYGVQQKLQGRLFFSDADSPTSDILAEGKEAVLAMEISGGIKSPMGSCYWPAVLAIGIWMAWFYLEQTRKERQGKDCILHTIFATLDTYRFLIKQLVSRDFKTKYKRSVLGAFWSLLNPLCTMAVQYVVFSTIFKSSIRNYPAYLLSASVLFNFFTESAGGGLSSIVGNAALITKVYVPKYIYPVTKVLSTSINLLISMLPLLAVILITGEPVTCAYLLIPYVVVCLLLFCAGMSMLLSALMVFFRDMQFLWGIISLLWMYATPMFYPEEIIPERFRFVLDWNPMYHYISFFRTILLEHVSPQISEYVICMAFSIGFCILGAVFFGKCQKKFALYL